MIELNENSYIIGLWYASDPITNHNWLSCSIIDPEKPGFIKGWYRIRYKKDDNVWNSSDVKNWVSFSSNNSAMSEDDHIKSMGEILENVSLIFPQTDCLIVKGDLSKFIELCKDKPWIHMKSEPIKEDDRNVKCEN